MKGIILAGGQSVKFYPLTIMTPNALLPVYDKPIIYYSLSILMMGGIKDILIISSPEGMPIIQGLLSDGREYGINISYLASPVPNGLADAFVLGEDFIGNDTCALVVSGTIAYGNSFRKMLQAAVREVEEEGHAVVFGCPVNDSQNLCIFELDENSRVTSFEEHPREPKSGNAIIPIYLYPSGVSSRATELRPSSRGELEISLLNQLYMNDRLLYVQLLDQDCAWHNIITIDSLFSAANSIRTLETHKGVKVSVLEEIAYENGWIDEDALLNSVARYGKSQYAQLLREVIKKDTKR